MPASILIDLCILRALHCNPRHKMRQEVSPRPSEEDQFRKLKWRIFMPRRIFAALLLCGVAAFVVQPAFAQTTPSILGTWQMTLIPNTPPDPPTIPIAGLATFHTDNTAVATGGGVLVGSIPNPVSPAPLEGPSPALGYWSPGPGPSSTLFVLQFTSLITNDNGTLFATRSFVATVDVNAARNQFSGTYSFNVTDPSGNVIASGSGTMTGKLIPRILPPA
jgi:hypothetical protein